MTREPRTFAANRRAFLAGAAASAIGSTTAVLMGATAPSGTTCCAPSMTSHGTAVGANNHDLAQAMNRGGVDGPPRIEMYEEGKR